MTEQQSKYGAPPAQTSKTAQGLPGKKTVAPPRESPRDKKKA